MVKRWLYSKGAWTGTLVPGSLEMVEKALSWGLVFAQGSYSAEGVCLLYWVRWGEGQAAWDQGEVGRGQLGRAGQK